MIFRETRPNRDWQRDGRTLPKAFGWDYWDCIDSEQSGFVIIRRTAPTAQISVTIYERGRVIFNLDSDTLHSWQEAEGANEISFSLGVPGSKDELSVKLKYPAHLIHERQDRPVPRGAPEPDHLWNPRCAAAVMTGDFRWGQKFHRRIEGRGYHDRHFSRIGWEDAKVDHWFWARFPRVDVQGQRSEVLFFWVMPLKSRSLRSQVAPIVWWLEVSESGRMTDFTRCAAMILEWKRNFFGGIRTPKRISVQRQGAAVEIRLERVLEKGSFYVRWMPKLSDGTVGIAHWIEPKLGSNSRRSFDSAWRRLVIKLKAIIGIPIGGTGKKFPAR